MSVIAWDGQTLAADRRANSGTFYYSTRKITRIGAQLLGYTGDQAFGEQMLRWYRDGAKPEDFPAAQRTQEDWAGLLVVHRDGTLHRYERTPFPVLILEHQFAVGSGRDFALAAMACGRSAIEAVEIACRFDSACGNGFDALTFEDGL